MKKLYRYIPFIVYFLLIILIIYVFYLEYHLIWYIISLILMFGYGVIFGQHKVFKENDDLRNKVLELNKELQMHDVKECNLYKNKYYDLFFDMHKTLNNHQVKK